MTEFLADSLRTAGLGLLALSLIHIPLSRRLNWVEQALLLTPLNGGIFRVHNFFIQVMLLMMALPCLLDPGVFLDHSRAGAWLAWSFAGFWAIRLYCQWFMYDALLWRGKRFETSIHALMTMIWLSLTVLFGWCGLRQIGLLAGAR